MTNLLTRTDASEATTTLDLAELVRVDLIVRPALLAEVETQIERLIVIVPTFIDALREAGATLERLEEVRRAVTIRTPDNDTADAISGIVIHLSGGWRLHGLLNDVVHACGDAAW
jgi:hypothetical protein